MVKVNEKGYTLLEMLIVFLVLITICSTFPLLLSLLEKWTSQPQGLHPFEWEIASAQMRMDVREGSEIIISQGKLLVKQPPNVITYELYQNILRRQVNGAGHEVILQHIRTVGFRYIESGLAIEVTDLEGVEYESKLYRWTDVMNHEN
ncbi:competence type IV pilus minor pilin ComGF [Bacillus pinisoli]|uniref:competence type IV pilus minor pilin ComGF n=1 Tax=Bacillus pinisoli TaxID=2901866 RepID=UPI001FF47267|nr:competence type IV pilus minor pilin ComGF [Bacillus pinisoli]